MKSGARVLIVWGSETKVTYNFVTDRIAKEWNARDAIARDKLLHLEIVNGDDMADRWDEVSSDNYDYLLVATSSYAEGDPPSGFGKFLYRCQETSKEFDGNTIERRPLYGLQHAVLGVGNTQYDTFQNIPRHIDKYLGECGSRRCKQRFEWDEMENSGNDVSNWAEEMLAIILDQSKQDDELETTNKTQAGSSKYKPEVCSWKEPSSELYQKTVTSEGWEDFGRTQFEISPMMMVIGAAVIAAGAWYNKQQYDNNLQN